MTDLDQLGRRHGAIVRSSVADMEPPPLDSLSPILGRRSRRAVWVALVSAAVVIAGFLPIAVLRNTAGPSDQTAPAASPTVSSEPLTTVGSEPSEALLPFDFESFLASKLDGALDEDVESRVGVIVLIPTGAEAQVDPLLAEPTLPEFDGYTYVPSELLEAAAERFVADRKMEHLEGEWVAYGLIPRFDDSPTADWAETLSQIPDAKVARVDFDAPTTQIPDGWNIVTDLPFDARAEVVEAVDGGIVVLQPDSTILIGFDGSWSTGSAPPIAISASCCASAAGLPAGSLFVLVAEGLTETWILDVDTLTWAQADPRPETDFMLGSAMIDGDLFVITAAARFGQVTSSLTALDVATGEWRELEPVPSPISVGGVTTDGSRLIVAGTQQDHNNSVIGGRNPVAYQYTPIEGWSQLPDIPIDGQASTVAWVDGAGLLAWNYGLESALLDQSGAWRKLDDVPMPGAECYPKSFPTVAGSAGLCGGIAWFDGTAGVWQPIRHPFDTRYVITTNAIFGLVRSERDQTQMIEYPLPPNGS